MVSEGALPVVWCVRDNQLVPHQVSGVKLQGAVTGAHIAAVTDFLRMVAGTPIILPHTAVPEEVDNNINQEKENTTRRRKMSMQVEVPCVFLSESALQKAKSRSNSLEEKVTPLEHLATPTSTKRYLELDMKSSFFSSTNNMLEFKDSSQDGSKECFKSSYHLREPKSESHTQRITRIIDLDDFNTTTIETETETETSQRITRIIEFENDTVTSPVCTDVDNESLQRITRIIRLNDDHSFSAITNQGDLEKESQRVTRIIEIEKDSTFPSMARIIEMENEISNERRISLTNERETGGGVINEEFCEEVIVRSKPSLNRSTPRFSVDSSCSENSYVNIECIKSLQDGKKEDVKEDSLNLELSPVFKPVRSRFPRKKTSVCSIGSSDCDDEVDVIFKSKPKSSQWVSLDWIPPTPKEEPVISHDCDKNDFISKWIADQNLQEPCIVTDERRKSLPPKSNEIYLQNMRRFSDGLQICKEDAASDSPATVKSKWHDIVKRHLQILKSDKGFRRQRGSWMRTARRLSGTHVNPKSFDSQPLDTYLKINTMS